MAIAAVWGAVTTRRLTYAVPPASFETRGQKVRTPSEIENFGLATCVGATLLFAAAFEAIGLYPVIVLTEGHAFCGAWLQPKNLPTSTMEDAAEHRKAFDLNELVLFETTLATEPAPAAFENAIREANRQITEDREDAFIYALDIRNARGRGIHPIPSVTEVIETPEDGLDEPIAAAALPSTPSLGDFDDDEDAPEPETPAERVELWKRRLLDLTRRNRLLNIRPSLGAISIFCPDPGSLEDQLADGKKLRIVAPDVTNEGDGAPDPALYRMRTGDARHERFLEEALGRS
jgi:hypothetical protein